MTKMNIKIVQNSDTLITVQVTQEIKITKMDKETKDKLIAAGREDLVNVIESGYAGVDSKGNIVDRRFNPKAIPVSSVFASIPEPKDIRSEGAVISLLGRPMRKVERNLFEYWKGDLNRYFAVGDCSQMLVSVIIL